MKRGLQWNTLILSARPSSPRNLHRSVTCPPKLCPDTLGLESCRPKFFQAAALPCNWLHFPQQTEIHVENNDSHWDILFTVGAGAVQRFWYGWKM
jgi:hypothetical protein